MTEAPINIWGKNGCEMPDGSLCTVCCRVFGFLSRWGDKHAVGKPIGEKCDFLSDSGCKIHGLAPDSCGYYHCSQSPDEVKKLLINTANSETRSPSVNVKKN